jgi:hypothetical protein
MLVIALLAVVSLQPVALAAFRGPTSNGVNSLTVTSSFYSATIMADSPASYWRLGGTTGNATDVMGLAGATGTYQNGVVRGVAGRSADGDLAATFDLTDDAVQAGIVHGFAGTASFTAEALVKPTSFIDGSALMLFGTFEYRHVSGKAAYYGWALFLYDPAGSTAPHLGVLRCNGVEDHGFCDYAMGGASLTAGTWYHLAATYNGTTMRTYVNGVQQATGTSTRSLPTSVVPFKMGKVNEYDNGALSTLDEVAVYSNVLTSTQLAAHAARAG